MERNQQYLTSLLEKVPKWELTDPQQQDAFEKIKLRLSNASDFQDQLKTLFRVTNFSDVALGLMWIMDMVSRDPSKLESTLEEEGFVLTLLKNAFGVSLNESTSSEEPFGFTFPEAPPNEASQPVEMAAESPVEGDLPAATTVGAGSGASEEMFSATLEKLLEAVQGGSEDRSVFLDELSNQAEGIVASQVTDSEYKTFCGYLMEFLKYVSSNQLFDDIRVMNLISNVYDPFSQWVKTDPAARTGILEQPVEMLRDFRTLFE